MDEYLFDPTKSFSTYGHQENDSIALLVNIHTSCEDSASDGGIFGSDEAIS